MLTMVQTLMLDGGAEDGYRLRVIHTMRLGASLRDRATLSSPLRGLAPSGGYPSRLRSLRSLRAPLARRLASLTAACRTATACAAFDGSRWHHRRVLLAPALRAALVADLASLALAGYARLRASPRLAPVPAPPRAGYAAHRLAALVRALLRSPPALRSAPCRAVVPAPVRDTAAHASGSVLRTSARGSVRTVRHSIAVTAPLRRVPRRRFPHRSYRRFGRPDRPGRPWVPHPTHR